MRIRMVAVLTVGLLLVAMAASAQSEYQSQRYRVISYHGTEHARATAQRVEALFALYNAYFRFSQSFEYPMTVRVFADRAAYDTYLVRAIGETREDFVYLHYTDRRRSELVGYAPTSSAFDVSFQHQAFIQFLRGFVPNPPLWMREGFAVYFEEAVYDADFGIAVLRENLAWLETVKRFVFEEATVDYILLPEMLAMSVEDARANIEVFYPTAWAMVSYLLNAPSRDVNRIVWDSISALKPEFDLVQNSTAVQRAAFDWVNEDILLDGFLTYFADKRTFRELVDDGVDAYTAGEVDNAEELFLRAAAMRADHHVPVYYLGLVNYDRGDFELAEYYYNQALALGADPALTNYALGVNAFAADRFEDAEVFLTLTLRADPMTFGEKARELLGRIRG